MISVTRLKMGGNHSTTQPEFQTRDPCAPLLSHSGPEPRTGARGPESPVLVTGTWNFGRNEQLSSGLRKPTTTETEDALDDGEVWDHIIQGAGSFCRIRLQCDEGVGSPFA
jgi:hypothetical protein